MDSLEDLETLISEEKIGSDTETKDMNLDLETGAIDELNHPAPEMSLLQRDSEDRDNSISEDKFSSSEEYLSDTGNIDWIFDFESGAIDELNQPAPGMWLRQTSSKHCCIFRVPHCIRQVNPEAYTPQSVIIGPLHHSLIRQALNSRGDITNTKLMGYLNMERLKKDYLTEFARRPPVRYVHTIDRLRKIIEEEEDMIRASYSESTAWIESPQFIDMILHDSIFIMEFIFRSYENTLNTGDYFNRKDKLLGEPLMEVPCLYFTVINDLLLLENQLPYVILEKLSDGLVSKLFPRMTFRELVIKVLLEEGEKISCEKISYNLKFRHFTDLIRFVLWETLPEISKIMTANKLANGGEKRIKHMYTANKLDSGGENRIKHMYTASKLDSGGVEFKAVKENFSLNVRFEKGCLKMSCLTFDDRVEIRLRNIMALEQCHYPYDTHVCNYISFLDCLIDTHQDVELLAEKGIIKNWIGQDGNVAEIVNKLCLGIKSYNLLGYSYYFYIADKVNAYYNNPFNRSCALLKRVYFGNLWTGTATFGATILLVMTLIQTVISILQTKK